MRHGIRTAQANGKDEDHGFWATPVGPIAVDLTAGCMGR